MNAVSSKGKTLVTGVIGEDVHITGIRILEHAFRNAGFNVVSLGIHTTQEEFIQAALESRANAILISSLGGHAEILLTGFREKCLESGLKNILLYVGGHLMIGKVTPEEIEKKFVKMGFNRVYSPNTLPDRVISDLKVDLGLAK